MGFMQRLLGRSPANTDTTDALEERSLFSPGDMLGAMGMLSTFGTADSGVAVTPQTALQAASVWACVSRIARDVATLPVHVIDRTDNSRVESHPVAELLRNPSDYMTPASFWTAYTMNALLYGNPYAYVGRDERFRPVELLPLMARDTEPRRRDGQLYYVTRANGQAIPINAGDVLHAPHMAMDGVLGMSPIAAGRQAIGTSLALEQFAARFFANGANLGGLIELPPMKREAVAETRQILQEQFTGLENAHRMLALPGAKAHRLGFSPRDSQSVEAQQWALKQVARLFSMPVGIIDPTEATYGNLENQYRDYAQATLRPWVVMFEQELGRKLFRADEQGRFAVRFNLDAVVRASLRDRMAADAQGVQAGILTINEARAHHDLQPLPDGDVLRVPLNMAPASEADERSQVQHYELRSVKPQANQADPRTRALLANVAGNVTRKEINAVSRAAKKAADPAEFRAWADQWFIEHRAHVEEVLAEPAGASDEYAAQHCDEARAEAIQAMESDDMNGLLARWDSYRIDAIVAKLLGDPPAN